MGAQNTKKYAEWGDLAERLYVERGMSAAQISAELKETPGLGAGQPPSKRAVEDWITKYGWKKRRRDFIQGPQGALASMEKVIPTVAGILEAMARKAELAPGDLSQINSAADSLVKITKSIRSLKGGMDIKEAMLVIMRPFVKWVLENEKPGELRDRMSEHIHNFSNDMMQRRTQ